MRNTRKPFEKAKIGLKEKLKWKQLNLSTFYNYLNHMDGY